MIERILRRIIWLVLIALVGLLAGCISRRPKGPQLETETVYIKQRSDIYGTDFRPYIKRGFLILPWRPDIEFDVVADVMMEFHPAGRLTTVRRLTPEVVKRATFGSKVTPADTSVVSRDWDSSQPWEISGALEELYRYCTALGADGFIQLRVTHRTHELGSKSHRDLVFSGYAIQRKR